MLSKQKSYMKAKQILDSKEQFAICTHKAVCINHAIVYHLGKKYNVTIEEDIELASLKIDI